jgi:hypothetical protein
LPTLRLVDERMRSLPKWARRYIHDILTRCDPADEVKERASLREQRDALVKKVKELEKENRQLKKRIAKR